MLVAQPESANSRIEKRREVDRAWERFIKDGILIPSVREDIAQSWTRTRAVHGIDPELRHPLQVLTGQAFEERCGRDDALRLVRPLFLECAELVTDHVVAYFDGQGYLLVLAGDPRMTERVCADISFRPGSNWSEHSVGTSGPGTALAARKPVEVFGSEHLVGAWQTWSCAAAPFTMPGDPAPVGIIDVSGPWETHSHQALGMARAFARAIEEKLRGAVSVREEVVRHALRAARDAGDGVVAVDARGRVLGMNDAASRRQIVLGGVLPPAMLGALAGVLAQDTTEREVSLHAAGAPSFTASPVRDGGTPVGAILRVPLASRSRGGRASVSVTAASVNGHGVACARYDFRNIVGASESLKRVCELARIASHNELPVVLVGESGTGKELFAHSIHAASSHEGGPFVTVNCGAIPSELIEAELFGYESGAFTGARKGGSAGRFEDANGGTIFLDEVAELPPHAQVALLRVLQEKEVVRIGASSAQKVDARVIAATNKPLDAEAKAGRFRMDLYFRLSVLRIEIPPLRDRGGDLLLLAQLFLTQAEREVGRAGLSLSHDALEVLHHHHWPGNVRELRNVILRAASMSPNEHILGSDLSLDFSEERAPSPSPAATAAAPAPAPSHGTLREAMCSSERIRLEAALEATGWNVARTAHELGVSRMTLYRLLHKYGLSRAQSAR